MATGANWQPGGVQAPPDVEHAGLFEWSRLTGIQAHHPLMAGGPTPGGYAMAPHDPDMRTARGATIITLPPGESTEGAMAMPEVLDDWRDLLDFRNSPAPYVLLLALAAIGLVQLRVSARGGPARANVGLG